MRLLIDGYNLLHVTGLFGGTFEASRAALLRFLAVAIDGRERPRVTIVFDASEAPPGLPSHYTVEGMHVHYARDHDSADALLEELIAAHHTPKSLTVVSSDHRVQRAARKRKATAVDSHRWYQEAHERLQRRRRGGSELPDIKPETPLTAGEVAVWVRAFGPVEIDEEAESPVAVPARPTTGKQPAPGKKKNPPPPSPAKKKKQPPAPQAHQAEPTPPPRSGQSSPPRRVKATRKPRRPPHLGFGDIRNPFPPGYGEDESPG